MLVRLTMPRFKYFAVEVHPLMLFTRRLWLMCVLLIDVLVSRMNFFFCELGTFLSFNPTHTKTAASLKPLLVSVGLRTPWTTARNYEESGSACLVEFDG